MDRRLTPANDYVAATHLQTDVIAPRYTQGTSQQVIAPVADLHSAPAGKRDRQLLMGDSVTVFDTRNGWAFVQARKDGYVGYLAEDTLGDFIENTHRVSVLASHIYSEPNFKSKELFPVSFGARLRVVSAEGNFFETDAGTFIPKPHVRPLNAPFGDPVTLAQMFFGVPYLWGGNSATGIDCSGVIQAAYLASGMECPGDSDLQEQALGAQLPENSAVQRGDLFFWKGHVALAVDAETIIHANVHHMAVAYEPLQAAIARIETQGDGPVTSHKRMQKPT